MSDLILYGAGGAGRYALSHLRATGQPLPTAFADNDPLKHGTDIEGITIMPPEYCEGMYPGAMWIACAISRPAAVEMRAHMAVMKVKTAPLWTVLPVQHGLPEPETMIELLHLVRHDAESTGLVNDQWHFRMDPDYDRQRVPEDVRDIYFPDFITHLTNERFVDCGAADGDTVRAFTSRWNSYQWIVAFEPDPGNYQKMMQANSAPSVSMVMAAVGDFNGKLLFEARGDWSSHIAEEGGERVDCVTLDDYLKENPQPPTYIKMDIEGAELRAIWGARQILKDHMPVLAICAYHQSSHLWEIPLLLHAIQPNYQLRFRRYAEGAFEIVWYAVPPERVI